MTKLCATDGIWAGKPNQPIYPYRQALPPMKTTLDISSPLLRRAKRVAAQRGTTLRALVEEGLVHVLELRAKSGPAPAPLPVFGAGGLTPEFQGAGWDKLRDTIYEGRGA